MAMAMAQTAHRTSPSKSTREGPVGALHPYVFVHMLRVCSMMNGWSWNFNILSGVQYSSKLLNYIGVEFLSHAAQWLHS